MRIAGQYVGLGEGDTSDEIVKIKALLKRKFTPARNTLDDGPLFTPGLTAEVLRVQAIYTTERKPGAPKYIPGVVNLEFKYDVGLLPRPLVDHRGVFVTACGTGVPWWVGPDADTARAVEDKYKWRPIGYRAAPFPMGASIAEGRAEGNRIITEERARIERFGLTLGGYSQGALVTGEIWEYDIKPVTGPLHWALPHMRKAVAWGNPMRERGKAWPDPGAPVADPGSGGVTPQLMVDTPDWWRNYAHHKDFYTEVADDEAAENKRAIWAIVRGTKVFSGPDSILAQVLEVLGIKRDASQILEVYGIVKALFDTGMFFAINKTTPHTNYNTTPAIEYLRAP